MTYLLTLLAFTEVARAECRFRHPTLGFPRHLLLSVRTGVKAKLVCRPGARSAHYVCFYRSARDVVAGHFELHEHGGGTLFVRGDDWDFAQIRCDPRPLVSCVRAMIGEVRLRRFWKPGIF